MHEKNKYRHIPWNRYNLEKYRDTDFWSYRPALVQYVENNVFFNFKPHKYIALHQIHKILLFLATSYIVSIAKKYCSNFK